MGERQGGRENISLGMAQSFNSWKRKMCLAFYPPLFGEKVEITSIWYSMTNSPSFMDKTKEWLSSQVATNCKWISFILYSTLYFSPVYDPLRRPAPVPFLTIKINYSALRFLAITVNASLSSRSPRLSSVVDGGPLLLFKLPSLNSFWLWRNSIAAALGRPSLQKQMKF